MPRAAAASRADAFASAGRGPRPRSPRMAYPSLGCAVTGCIIKLDIDVRIVLAAFIAALHGGPAWQG